MPSLVCASLLRLPAWLKGGQHVPTKAPHEISGCSTLLPALRLLHLSGPRLTNKLLQAAAPSCSTSVLQSRFDYPHGPGSPQTQASPQHHAHPQPGPKPRSTPAAELGAVPRRRRVLCHVLWSRTHSHIPSPDPLSSSWGYQQGQKEISGCRWVPTRGNISHRESKTQLVSWDQPAQHAGKAKLPQPISAAQAPRKSKECITDTVRYSHQRQELCSAPGHPNSTAGTRGHKLARTGWDSTFRCVKAIQRALSSFKNYP